MEHKIKDNALKVTSSHHPFEDTTKRLLQLAHKWRPGDEYKFVDSIPCSIVDAKHSRKVSARVGWHNYPDGSENWRSAGGDVRVLTSRFATFYRLPCKVPGSHKMQEKYVYLRLRIDDLNIPDFADLRGKLAAHFAHRMRSELNCSNAPHIPGKLT
ncbi:hypothetical protein ACQPZG_27175 [Streptomyces sp. CA-294286]|uniref:hypothetical protein n=1 Tax=Streptomyces sp. CA-294286 TaxID=3240070 RepID=UPI003D8A684D